MGDFGTASRPVEGSFIKIRPKIDAMHFDLYLTKVQKCQKPEITISQRAIARWSILILCYTARSYTVKERNFILDYTYDQAMYSKVILGSKTTEM